MVTLTREQILAEPAGRRMDAWVAEHVMGWVLDSRQQACVVFHDAAMFCYVVDEKWTPRCPHKRFLPSVDIAAAWQVVEKVDLFISRTSVDLDVGFVLRKNQQKEWEIFYRWGSCIVSAETAPLAICRAALLATL